LSKEAKGRWCISTENLKSNRLPAAILIKPVH